MSTAVSDHHDIQEHIAGKYLTFRLADEAYGLGILSVQEIIGVMTITRIPQTPNYVRGVINLRGKVIPVVDLRMKFGMDACQQTDRTCVIVVQIGRNGGQATLGLLVDEVSEVLDFKVDQIEAPPSIGSAIDCAFLLGVAKTAERVIMLLDADRALSCEEIGAIASQGEE